MNTTIDVIDSDTHVDETDATWDFVQADLEPHKPYTGFPKNQDPNRPLTRYWMIDGQRKPRHTRDDAKSGTTVETRELIDVDKRLRDMDRLGVSVQVIYPTLLLVEPAQSAEAELAITGSYNRWMADRCAKSGGRLRWVAVPPTRSMDAALEMLRWAKENGACGILKKGDREGGKWPADEYFFPLYEEAGNLDLPICMHLGSGVPNNTPAREFTLGGFMTTALPVIHGVYSLIQHEIPKKFPKLRIGAIESGLTWIPYVAYDLRRREETRYRAGSPGPWYTTSNNIFKDNNIWVSCQVDEDIPYLLPFIGEDNILVGSDYTHQDAAQELAFVKTLEERVERGEISGTLVRKIVHDNPKTFYGL
jgi:predicted TIM-barrel fold metal-dependent hydrolase